MLPNSSDTEKVIVMRQIVVAAMMLLLAGCSTVLVHLDEPAQLHPYKGSRTAIAEVARAWRDPLIPGEATVRAFVDVPLCIVADTVLLPVDWLVMSSQHH